MRETPKKEVLVAPFLKHLTYEKRYSLKTISAYRADLCQFTTFIALTFQEKSPEKANYHMIREWIIALIETGKGARSINRKIACLRSFYKFCMKKGFLEKTPMLNIKALKTPKKLPHFVKEEEINQLLDSFDFPDTFEGWRDRMVLELLYGTGIRQSELIDLKESQINTWEHTIKVLGKRNKERIIPFPQNLTAKINTYRAKKNQALGNNEQDILFVTRKGAPMYPLMVYRTVRKYLDLFSTAEKRSPHVLRHTFATHILNRGAEINAVKDLLGHSSLAATQIYTHNSIEKLKKVFNQAHPKA